MSHEWDEFSKSLADQSVPRRKSLRLLGAALAGALLGPLAPRAARAAGDVCKTFCNRYPKSQRSSCLAACQACNGDTSRLCAGGSAFTCCVTGTTCCHGYCADLANDFDNCGACSAACSYPGPYEDGACVDGQCFYSCVEGTVVCDGRCSLLDRDPDNCGACGNVCPETARYCLDGICVEPPCAPGTILCDGQCVDPLSDRLNCGGCGQDCGPSFVCAAGACCDPGTQCCGPGC